MKQLTFIVKARHFLKVLVLIYLLVFTTALSFPAGWQERLARLPYVGKFFKPAAPPLALKDKAYEALEQAYWEGAPFYVPELWEEAQKYFEKGQKALEEGKNAHARYYFEKALKLAKQAQEKTKAKQKQLNAAGARKFEQVLARWRKASIAPEQRLKWEIRLLYLKELLDKGRYKEFFEEAEIVEKELSRLKPKEGASAEAPSPRDQK